MVGSLWTMTNVPKPATIMLSLRFSHMMDADSAPFSSRTTTAQGMLVYFRCACACVTLWLCGLPCLLASAQRHPAATYPAK